MKRWLGFQAILVAILAVSLVALACARATPTPTPRPPTPTAAPALSPYEKWEQEYKAWEKTTYAAALKEGKLVIYGWSSPDGQRVDIASFGKKYPGITLEYVTGRSGGTTERLRTEKQTRQYVADLYTGGQQEVIVLGDEGLSEDFHPPAADEPGVTWITAPVNRYGNQYPTITPSISPKGVVLNTKLVPPEKEPKSWWDLTKPEWKGQLRMDDARGGGSPGSSWLHWAWKVEPTLGEKFVLALAANAPVMIRDTVGGPRNAALGEYPMYFPAFPQEILRLAGMPAKFVFLEPGTEPVVSARVLIRNAPHPNAAKLYMNYYLTKESMIINAAALASGPNRADVPVPDERFSLAGKKVWLPDVAALKEQNLVFDFATKYFK